MDPVSCPQCGKSFACAGGPECWCFEFSLSPEKLEMLKKMSDECFCPECLREAALTDNWKEKSIP